MNKIIIPTGYMGSGSSAITDLVREFRGTKPLAVPLSMYFCIVREACLTWRTSC